jgi:hypothetical protein
VKQSTQTPRPAGGLLRRYAPRNDERTIGGWSHIPDNPPVMSDKMV